MVRALYAAALVGHPSRMKLLLTLTLNLGIFCLSGMVAARAETPEKAGKEGGAITWHEEEFTCPIDGTQWKQRIESRGKPAGLRLDLKQVGDVIQPPSVPHCPKCGMVLFSEKLPVAVVTRLKPFILGPDYQMLAAKSPVYARLAQIQDFLGAPPIYPAYSYLRASWEVEGKETQHQRFLAKALEYFTKTLAGMEPEDKERLNIELLCGELERRLKLWDAAGERFRKLGSAEQVAAEPRIEPVVVRQMQLIAAKDSHPHILGDLPGAKVKAGDNLQFAPKRVDEAPRAPKPRLKPLDMHQSLVMTVEEPALPLSSRAASPAPSVDLPRVEELPAAKIAAVGKNSPETVAKPTVAKEAPPKVAEAGKGDEPENPEGKFPNLDQLPTPKVEVKPKAETEKVAGKKTKKNRGEEPTPRVEAISKVEPAKPAPKPKKPEVTESAPKVAVKPKVETPKAEPKPKAAPEEVAVAKVETKPPKAEPKPEAVAVVKTAPPTPKPKPELPAAVLAPSGEKKSRPKLIGAP